MRKLTIASSTTSEKESDFRQILNEQMSKINYNLAKQVDQFLVEQLLDYVESTGKYCIIYQKFAFDDGGAIDFTISFKFLTADECIHQLLDPKHQIVVGRMS